MRELKHDNPIQMREVKHENLNGFVGACIDPPNVCVLTEYCSRGSLRDVLDNGDVRLDNVFIASLVGDLLRGLVYLHESPLRFHGRLTPSNCLVDSRWTLRLSDYGPRALRRVAEPTNTSKDPLLYKAPELRHSAESGSPKGDMYSFGCVLYEIHVRKNPFGETTTEEAAQKAVGLSTSVTEPPRPPLEAPELPEYVRECVRECWREEADSRPDVRTVRVRLRPLRRGLRPNILDNMMAMMERYATQLEALVDERTAQLQHEKRKTEALLCEMLPAPVADRLKRGLKVTPEIFDCVTVYFSDIVGFTALSARSTPLQVVDLLNDLYTCFDEVLDRRDVYKVETIGDAYMVVSGLPIRNGDRHAAEIASMALSLLERVRRFVVPHNAEETLKLRVGVHSGPVCAGVVGLKMPRYCLFGDTVNTASRMESTGARKLLVLIFTTTR